MVRSLKADVIETDKIKKAKEISKKFRSQLDESSAGAMKYDDDEEQMIMTQKLQSRIILQYNLRETHLACMYDMAQLKELEKIHKTYFGEFITKDGVTITGKLEFHLDKNKNVDYGFINDITTGKMWKSEEIKKTTRIDGTADDKKPLWYGLPMPITILAREFDIIYHRFKQNLMKVTSMSTQLTHLGFSLEQVKELKKNGKVISKLKELEKMEKEYEDKRLDRAGVVNPTKKKK